MTWVTIYDVETSWALWIAGGCTLLSAAFGIFLLIGIVRSSTENHGAQLRKSIVGLFALFASPIILFCLSVWSAYSNYALRSDLIAGRYLETEGFIEEARIEPSGKSISMYFRVGGRWFALPYQYPRSCYPHNGDPIKLVFEISADHPNSGAPAHDILRMQVTHPCSPFVWG
jgi:hypothetical protein